MTLKQAIAIAEKEEARAKKRKSSMTNEELKDWEEKLNAQASIMAKTYKHSK